jgi:MFS transporter, putative metabolite:H+ symporter
MRRHLVVVLIVGAGWFWDVSGISIGGVLSAVFSEKTSPIPTGALSWVVASTYLGASIGAPALGWTADRFGRRGTLVVTLLLLAVSTCGAALSPNIEWLIVCRTLSGIAIGAYLVVSIPYLAETLPVQARGRMLLVAAGIGAVAVPATLLGARWLANSTAGSSAWRWLCAICAVGSALTGIAMLRLPESPQWLRSRLQAGAASESINPAPPNDAHHVQPGVLATFTILLNVLAPWATVGFPILSGAVLVSRGFSVTDAFLFSGLGAFGTVFGLFAASWKIDALERRTVLIGCALLIAVCAIWFPLASRPAWIVVAGVLVTTGTAICIQTQNIYLAEMFSTRVRALGASSGSLVYRLTSVCVPLVLLPVLHSRGAIWLSAIQVGAMLLSAALLAIAPRGYAGRPIH